LSDVGDSVQKNIADVIAVPLCGIPKFVRGTLSDGKAVVGEITSASQAVLSSATSIVGRLVSYPQNRLNDLTDGC